MKKRLISGRCYDLLLEDLIERLSSGNQIQIQTAFIHKLITFNEWGFRMFCDSYVQFSMPRYQGRGSKLEYRPRFGFSSLRSIMYSLSFSLFISSTPQITKSTHIVIVQNPHSYASTANFLSLSSNKQSSSNAHLNPKF